MKKINSIIAIVTLSIAFSTSATAQATATATASATIVTPISIVKDLDMSFGNLAVSSTTAGTVAMPASATPTRDVTGGGAGVTLPGTTGTVNAAKFTVSGQTSYTYTITLPSTASLTSGTSPAMSLGSFISSIAVATGALSSATPGVETFYVGATLTVAANQPAGSYTTVTGFPVTVNYN